MPHSKSVYPHHRDLPNGVLDMATWEDMVRTYMERNGYVRIEKIYRTKTARFGQDSWGWPAADHPHGYERAIIIRHDGLRVGVKARFLGDRYVVEKTWPYRSKYRKESYAPITVEA